MSMLRVLKAVYSTRCLVGLVPIVLVVLLASCSEKTAGFSALPRAAFDTAAVENSFYAHEYFLRARDIDRRGMPQAALPLYQRALQYAPESPGLRRMVVEGLILADRFQQAAEILLNDRRESALSDSDLRLLAQCYSGAGRTMDAIRVMGAIRKPIPEDISLKGAFFEAADMTGPAIEAYIAYLEQEPDDEIFVRRLAGLHVRRKEWSAAENDFARLLPITGDTAQYLSIVGDLRLMQGDSVASVNFYRSALLSDSACLQAWHGLARLHAAQGKTDEAIRDYQGMAASDSIAGVTALKTIGMLQFYTQKPDSARVYLTRYATVVPYDAEALYFRAAAEQATGDTAAALESFKAVAALDTIDPDPCRSIAWIAMHQKKFDLAEQAVVEAIDRDSTDPGSFRLLGFIYNASHRYADAAATLQHALMMDSSIAPAWFEFGSSLERTGRFSESVAAFKMALSIDSSDASAANYLGYMLADSGIEIPYAASLIRSALAAEPDNGAYLDSYGWVLFRQGSYDSAQVYIEKALAAIGSDPVVFEHMAEIELAKGAIANAISWFEKAIAAGNEDAEALKARIESLRGQGAK